MKPFNLKDALAGKPVVNRDGTRVTQIAYFPAADPYPVYALLEGSEAVDSFTELGNYFSQNQASGVDLFMASTKKTGFVNIYRENIREENGPTLNMGSSQLGHTIHPNVEVADAKKSDTKERIAVVKITWEA